MMLQHCRDRIRHFLRERPDDSVLNAIFGALIAATIAVLVLDYAEMAQASGEQAGLIPSLSRPTTLAPSATPLPGRRGGEHQPPRSSDKALASPMNFDLRNDGRLLATGTIVPGSADALAAEIEKRGAYVRTIVLHSPGGSVQDALKMGRLVRAKGFATEVAASQYCASSCPLVFAGGVERRAGKKAAIGVHQISAATNTSTGTLANGMENAQRVTAEVQRYLRDMGVDTQVWVHAMETPRNELFYFKPAELLSLRLATVHADKAGFASAR